MVLLSGGIDSSACVEFYRRQQFDQPAEQQEESAAKAVARHYSIPLNIIRLEGTRPKMSGESADQMCRVISEIVGDSVSVVDLVFWRYATITSSYDREFGIDAVWSQRMLEEVERNALQSECPPLMK